MAKKSLENGLKQRLGELRAHIRKDPLSNPVRQLAYEVSKDLQAGRLSLADIGDLIKSLSDDAFAIRAGNLKSYLGCNADAAATTMANIVANQSTSTETISAYNNHWQKRRDVVVFTAHPTFILSAKQRSALSTFASTDQYDLAEQAKNLQHQPDEPITLAYEHEAVMAAMDNATTAISSLHETIIEQAKRSFPSDWRQCAPSPINIASWVGYDMDGRNDIRWHDVILHRLKEKLYRLEWYAEQVANLNSETDSIAALTARLNSAIQHTSDAVAHFSADEFNSDVLKRAADHLTDNNANLTSTTDLLALLDQAIAEADDDTALALLTLKADMATFRLGAGEMHFRLNASQIRNAARHVVKITSDDLFGRKALDEIETIINNVEPVAVNFASLAIEKASASRLFIAMSQILKHIDADQPIRLLIAECENPVTVLSAVYLAKLFGVDEKVDVCPLFETANALDRSRRILDVLLSQSVYQAYARKRGCVAIQAGFSDAGRFMGQIPASLAIERLQGHFADIIHKHGLNDLTAIVFDTHGESMGRGNHQLSFTDRALYALSPWARNKFARHGIHLVHETSFQGGDGYVLFGNPELATCVINGILGAHSHAAEALEKHDLFYEDISTSLDFYRNVKARQEDLFEDSAYHITLSSLGLSLLPTTGSRKAKRQFERRSDEDRSLRKIRAIPHNAILQQMGLLANIIGGIGGALSSEPEYFVNLNESSDRFGRLMRLVARANYLTELKTFIAYMKLFDGSFWATRPLTGDEPDLERPCADLAALLSTDNRYFSALQLAARMRSDSLALAKTLTQMDLREENSHVPESLDLLHVMRIALIQHLFILAAQLPAFAPQTGHTKEDVMEMIFSLHIPEAVELLRSIFPTDAPSLSDYQLQEGASYPDSAAPQYATIQEEIVDPLQECHDLLMQITNGVSHFYGAIG
jgi:phosphoenolpyruvate carboxylase